MNENGTIEKEKIYKETEEYGRVQFVDKIYELREISQKYKNFMEYYRNENEHLKETNEEHRKINGDLRKENQKLAKENDILSDTIAKIKDLNRMSYLNEKNFKYSMNEIIKDYDEEKYISNKLTELKGGSDESLH